MLLVAAVVLLTLPLAWRLQSILGLSATLPGAPAAEKRS
jgi:hypothetical protein